MSSQLRINYQLFPFILMSVEVLRVVLSTVSQCLSPQRGERRRSKEALMLSFMHWKSLILNASPQVIPLSHLIEFPS